MMSKTLLLVDDHKMILEGLKHSIQSSTQDVEIIGEANNGREAIEFCRKHAVDLVIMDIAMPEIDGLHATEAILKHKPEQNILIFTMSNSPGHIERAIQLGAKGFLNKNAPIDQLILAINRIFEEGHYFTSEVSKIVFETITNKSKQVALKEQFTDRELEFIRLISKGHTTQEIAENFAVSLRTVENITRSIKKKTEAKNLIGILVFAIKNELVKM